MSVLDGVQRKLADEYANGLRDGVSMTLDHLEAALEVTGLELSEWIAALRRNLASDMGGA